MHTRTPARLLLCMLVWLTIASGAPARAQAPDTIPLDHLPALAGGYFPLDTEDGRRYHVYVRVPEGYADAPDKTWPVVYVLDGDSLFPLLAPTHLFLHYDEGLPDAIIVGIAYGGFDPSVNRRNIDFSAPGDDTPAGEDGAPAFLETLRTQLMAEVERRFRVDPARRVLVGQSRAGYFVLWSALQAPDLFWGRIASNPAFTRTRDALFAPPSGPTRAHASVVLVSGGRDLPLRVRNAHDWHGVWTAREDRPWSLQLIDLPTGTHAASIGEGYRQAMLWLFRDEVVAPTP